MSLFFFPLCLVGCNRQLLDQTVKKDEMDGFVLHLQNEQKESIMRAEEAGLHLYSNRDVDM